MHQPMLARLFLATVSLALLALAGCRAESQTPPTAPSPAVVAHVAAAQAADELASPTPEATPAPPPTATQTATASPTSTSAPTATPTATPTPTPQPQAVRLTDGGCCTQPFWSPDSQQVRFIDKPDAESPAGIWGVAVAAPQSKPLLVSERIALSTAGPDYLVETDGDTTVIERLADGERWTVPARGRTVRISPDQTRIAWAISNNDLAPEQQVAAIWVANLDGSAARQVATLPRGGVSGWIDADTLLISGRASLQAREQTLSALSLTDGTTVALAQAERLRGQALSPGGQWIAYYVTFDAAPAQNGLWLARTDGSQRRQLEPGLFGAYQWRGCPDGCAAGEERLLIIPFDPEAAFHRLLELDPATGQARPLTDPAVTPFKIANGDWRVSPDGRYVAFVESSDRNVWVLNLLQ